jgi:hypothetical protein
MATTYYLASDGCNNCNTGISPSSPWQTIDKINGITLNPGDTVCFRCGDTWYEQLLVRYSGNAGNPITWTSFSPTGDFSVPPVISGFKIVPNSAWSASGAIREAQVDGAGNTLNVVNFGLNSSAGVNQPIGRYPALTGTTGTWARTINIPLITVGTTTLFTSFNHGLALGDVITFSTTGTLPAPLQSAPVPYYVIAKTSDTFQVSAQAGGASVSTSGTYSGTVTGVTNGKSSYNMISSVLSFNFTTGTGTTLSASSIPAGFIDGTAVTLATAKSLPPGLSTGTNYFVKSVNQTAGTFELSVTPGGNAVAPGTGGEGPYAVIWGIVDDNFSTAPGAADFNGGEIVIRKASWILDRAIINGATNSGIFKYTDEPNANKYNPAAGWGYFIQNHLACLTSLGNWCYDGSAQKLKLYFGDKDPLDYVVKASAIATNVSIDSEKSYNTFLKINFEGANQFGISGKSGCSNIQIISCGFSNIGQDAINFAVDSNSTTSGLTISNCTFNTIANNGITLRGPNSSIITDCTFTGIHTVAGMGQSGDGNGYALLIATADPAVTYNNVVTLNTINNCGYVPIGYTGSSCLIQYNYINNYCYIKDDGGGIYGGSTSLYSYAQRYILNNIIFNGIGAPVGRPAPGPAAHGIYSDDYGTDVSIFNNTIAHIQGAGLMIHNSDRINIQGNVIYDCMLNNFEPSSRGIISMVSDTLHLHSGTLQNIIFKGNVIWSSQPLPYLFQNVNKDDSAHLTITGDYNFYHAPLAFDKFFFSKQLFGGGVATKYAYNLHTWRGATGQDISSRDKMPSGLKYAYTLNTPAKVTQAFFDSNGNIAPSGGPGTILTQSNCDFSRDDVKLGSRALTITPHDTANLATFYINMGNTTAELPGVQYFVTFNMIGSTEGFVWIDIDRTFKLDFGRINVVETRTIATASVCIMKNNATAPAQLLQITIPKGTGAITINNLCIYTGILSPPDTSTLRFEYNATRARKEDITLERDYYDAAYNFHPAGKLALEPFSSLILMPVSP